MSFQGVWPWPVVTVFRQDEEKKQGKESSVHIPEWYTHTTSYVHTVHSRTWGWYTHSTNVFHLKKMTLKWHGRLRGVILWWLIDSVSWWGWFGYFKTLVTGWSTWEVDIGITNSWHLPWHLPYWKNKFLTSPMETVFPTGSWQRILGTGRRVRVCGLKLLVYEALRY